jgi:hypothetical protein
MIVDELGTGDVPWADSTIHAPTLQKLGTEGLRLGSQYAWQWCAPTRGALLSGRFVMHTGYGGGGMPGAARLQQQRAVQQCCQLAAQLPADCCSIISPAGAAGDFQGMDLRVPLLPGELKQGEPPAAPPALRLF